MKHITYSELNRASVLLTEISVINDKIEAKEGNLTELRAARTKHVQAVNKLLGCDTQIIDATHDELKNILNNQ